MRILVSLDKSPTQRYLVRLFTKKLVRDVMHLSRRGKLSKAIIITIKEGMLEREVREEELPSLDVDMILSKDDVRWDLT